MKTNEREDSIRDQEQGGLNETDSPVARDGSDETFRFIYWDS